MRFFARSAEKVFDFETNNKKTNNNKQTTNKKKKVEKDEIAKKCTTQDVAIRQMRTKFSKLESLFKQKQRSEIASGGGGGNSSSLVPSGVDLGDGDGVVGGRRADKDNEILVADLYKRNAKLQRSNKALEAKNKSLGQTIAKVKRELQLARRRGGTKSAMKAVNSSSRGDDSLLQSSSVLGSLGGVSGSNATSSKLTELVDKLRHRLVNAEKQLGKLRDENGKLRNGNAGSNVRDEGDAVVQAGRSAKWKSSTAEGEEVRKTHNMYMSYFFLKIYF